ncbi:MAG: DNA polymerase I [bacterium]
MSTSSKRRTLYLVDGPNIAFRAFFAIGGMKSSHGLPTNALFGFTNMLLKLIKDERPDHLAIAWDPPGKTHREERYPEYKGTRPDMPEDLRAQMPYFQRIAEAFGIPFLEVPRYEADDVIATLTRRHEHELDVVIVTSDKDLMQLVGDHVSLLDTMKDKRIGRAEVQEKFGCAPEQVPDALAIWGDTSDNIPGVKGIGEKGVKALLAKWGSLADIYANLDRVEPAGTRKKLEADRDNAYLSLELATVASDAPVEARIEDLALAFPPPVERARPLFTELEFRGLLREFGGEMVSIDRSAYRLVTSADELAELAKALRRADRFAVDTETTSLRALEARLVGLSFCCDDRVAWYVPVAHHYLGCPPQLDWDTVRDVLGPLLEDPDKGKVGQNLKYDVEVLGTHGVDVRGIDGDTLLADYLLSPERRSHNLDDLALVHLQHRMITYEQTVPKGETFASVPVEQARDYSAEDAHVTWLLDKRLAPRLESEGLGTLYRELEVPLIPVLARMEANGIAVDRRGLRDLSHELDRRIGEAEEACYRAAGTKFSIGSVPQLREILFDKLQLPVLKKTKTGASTDEAVLSELAIQHPLPQAILDYRSLVKLKNTYVDTLPTLINPRTGRIHTNYSQTTAATGRLSSSDPNLQNIPIRTAEGRRIRHAFCAPEGRLLLAADYSQVELRVLAHLVGGKGGFADAFAAGIDVHTQTAAGIFGVPVESVDKEQRRIAKAVNFGILYGQGAHGLAQTTGISRTEAKEYLRRYGERFPEVAAYQASTIATAREKGYVETLLGRRRRLGDLTSGSQVDRAQAERMALNTPIQGTAADLIKKAMIAIDRRLAAEHPGQLMLLQVHDELVFEVDESRVDAVREMVVDEMTHAIELAVPLVVDTGVGRHWDETD